MKKTLTILVILFVSFFLFLPSSGVRAQSGKKSGTVADYAGRWILKDMTVEDTYWTLDITADGKYQLHNKYQKYEGEVDFGPAADGSPPSMILDIDPENGIDMFLICTPNTLVDFSQQNLTFVRPGTQTDLEDGLVDITGEFIGDWLFTGLTVYHPSMTLELSADQVFSTETTRAMRWLINLKDGIVTYTALRDSSKAVSAPIARYRDMGRGSFMYKNPIKTTAEMKLVGRVTGDKMALQPFPVGEDLYILFHFVRFTGAEPTAGGD